MNQFNPVTMLATSIQNVRVASEVYGKDAGYMWEAQLLQASVMPLRVGGSILVAAGTAAQFVPGPGTVVGGIMIAVGAALSAAGNSIHVDPKTGKRSYQMTDQGAMNTLVDVVGGATGGAVAGNAVAAGNAAASQGAVAAANAAAAATKAGSAYAMATMTGLNLVNSGMEYDSDGRYTGHWSLSGERGDNALIGTAIAFASAGTASAMKLQQGTLASDLTRSIFSTGMHMTVQYGKMYAGHDNNYAAMAESDFSDLGSVLGTMMQSQSRDWQNDLADWAKDANDFNRTQRVLDLITGAGVFGRRENGELFYDAPEQAADTAWGRFWEGGMSTLGGYGALAGVIGEGLGAVWDGLKYVTGFSEGGFWEKAGNFVTADSNGERWNWETDVDRQIREVGVCFTAQTPVIIGAISKSIEEIAVGDEVMSWDEYSGEIGPIRVASVIRRTTDELYDVIYEGGNIIETTWNHPFFIEERGWVRARDLRVGDRSVTLHGPGLRIESITRRFVDAEVFNIHLESRHTYFVGSAAILVHNYLVKFGTAETARQWKARVPEALFRQMMKSQDAPLHVDSMHDVQELQPERFVTKDGKVYTRTDSPGELRYNCNGRDGVETIAIVGNGMQLQQISKPAGNQNKLFDSNGREITDQGVYNQVLVSHYKNVADVMRESGAKEHQISAVIARGLASHLDAKGGGRGLTYGANNPVQKYNVNGTSMNGSFFVPEAVVGADGQVTIVARFNGKNLATIDCSAFVSLAHYVAQGNTNVSWAEAWTHTGDGVVPQFGGSYTEYEKAFKERFTGTNPTTGGPYMNGPSNMSFNGRDYEFVPDAAAKGLIEPGMMVLLPAGPNSYGTPNLSGNGGTYMLHTAQVVEYKPGELLVLAESRSGFLDANGPGVYTYNAKNTIGTGPYARQYDNPIFQAYIRTGFYYRPK
ncbi:Hint domain-containing protein [Leptonema illini]|nr:Hint domain-containing protein [Leptonema illini]